MRFRHTGNDAIDWVTAMRTEGALVRNIRGQITMIRWALRLSMALCGAAVLYSWMQPKPLTLTHKKVPTYSMMAGE